MKDQQLSHSKQSSVLTKATIRASKRLGIDQTLFSQLLEIDLGRTLLLNTEQKALDPHQREWRHAILLVGCYSALCKLLGDDDSEKIAAWMTNDNNDLGGAPILLLNQPNGLKQFEQFLSNYLRV